MAVSNRTKDNAKITPTMTVRDVVTIYPEAAKIFDKYGLSGCGGASGPVEPVGFFASVHRVDPALLLQELNDLAANGSSREAVAARPPEKQADIYRPFVKAAVIIALTVGCTLGAVNLASMALYGVTGSNWVSVTQAHAHAQIFGWVGLFIMGVVYHVLPRLKATELKGRTLATTSFWLVLGGIVLRLIGQPFATNAAFADLVVLASALELVGASFFVYVCLATFGAGAQARDYYDKYMIASAAWFWLFALATLAISVYTAASGIDVIPTAIDNPYLHIGLMGFVAMMIFGFSLRTVPLFMGLQAPNKQALSILFWPLNAAIGIEAIAIFAAGALNFPLAPTVVLAMSIVEWLGVIAFVYFVNIFRKPEIDIAEAGADQSYEKYIRAAYAWLLIAATMALAYSAFPVIAGFDVPHAFVGAYRHALTVGFISMMILGMASRIIPVFTGVRLYSTRLLLATFVLINVGNTTRVLSQPLASAFGGPFTATMGISGFIEVTALSLFAYNIWKTMNNAVES